MKSKDNILLNIGISIVSLMLLKLIFLSIWLPQSEDTSQAFTPSIKAFFDKASFFLYVSYYLVVLYLLSRINAGKAILAIGFVHLLMKLFEEFCALPLFVYKEISLIQWIICMSLTVLSAILFGFFIAFAKSSFHPLLCIYGIVNIITPILWFWASFLTAVGKADLEDLSTFSRGIVYLFYIYLFLKAKQHLSLLRSAQV